MMIHVLKYDREYSGMIELKGGYAAYAVAGDAHDYVEETSQRLQQLAQTLYSFPFYLYFESDDDSHEWILREGDFDIRYMPSGRTITRQSGRNTFHQVEVPAFTVAITDEVLLSKAFAFWFDNAFNNYLWAMTQQDTVYYENGFAAVDLAKDMTILLTEHDAAGFTFVTNRADLQEESLMRDFLEGTIHY
ncbi:MAG: hypothetical protein ABS951_07065 [Solibacillus sp.]